MNWKAKSNWFKEKYFYPLISLIIILFLWHFYTKFFAIPDYILPSPYQVLIVFQESGHLLMKHSLVTLQEIILGFTIGAIAGFILAIALVSFRILYKTLYPLLVALQSIPKLALAPLFIIWFGFGILPKIIITTLVVLFPVLINTSKGLMTVEPELLDLLKSLQASNPQILLKIRLPSCLPYFFASLKISITLAVVGAIIGEFVGADRGLGYVIMLSSVNLTTSLMFAALILLGVIGLSLFGAICALERLILPWHMNIESH